MFIKEHNQIHLTLGYAQFAIAIALDSLNCYKAVRPVLSFLGTNTSKDPNKIAKIVKDRKELEKMWKSSNTDPIRFLLQYFEDNPVLYVVKYQNHAEHFRGPYTLGKLCESISPDEINDKVYTEACKLFFSTQRNKFIVKYMKTNSFKVEFSNFIRRKVRAESNFTVSSALDDGTIYQLLDMFTDYVDKACTDVGKYSPDTGTPENYLFRSKQEQGPFTWFCMDKGLAEESNNTSLYYNVLNEVGIESEITSGDGENSMSIIDTFSIEQNSNEYEIDFINVCERIYRASRILFSHGNEKVLRYDIFTHHRIRSLGPTIKNFQYVKNNCLVGVDVTYNDYSAGAIDAGDTYSNKLRARIKISDVFEDVLKDGIRKSEIYSDLYDKRIRNATIEGVGNSGKSKDGKALFSMNMFSLGHSESDGEMLNVILDGYMALKELITFLDSSSNTTGATLNNFPIEIFRDASRTRRFRNLEEYLKYNTEVKLLCNEVDENPIRSKVLLNSVLSNDSTYSIITSSKASKTDTIVQKLKETKIGFILEAVQKQSVVSGAGLDKILEKQFDTICRQLDTAFKSPLKAILKMFSGGVNKENLLNCEKAIYSLSKTVVGLKLLPSSDPGSQINNSNAFAIASIYLQLLEAVMEIEEITITDENGNKVNKSHRVIDKNGMYLLAAPTLVEEMDISNPELIEYLGKETIINLLLVRIQAIKNCMNIFWKRNHDLNDFRDNPSWEELRLTFYVGYIVYTFFDTDVKYLNNLNLCRRMTGRYDVQLMFAKAAGDEKFLSLKKEISTAQDLISFLPDKGFFSYMPTAFSVSNTNTSDEIKQLTSLVGNTERDVVYAMRNLFSSMDDLFDFVKVISERIDDLYGNISATNTVDSELETNLRKAVSDMMKMHETGEIVRLRAKIESLFETDSIGLIMVDGKRFSYLDENKRLVFIHRSGRKVIYNKRLKLYDILDLTDKDISDVKLIIQFS